MYCLLEVIITPSNKPSLKLYILVVEVVYPGRRNNGLARDLLSSVRFFQAFRVQFIPNTVCKFNNFFFNFYLTFVVIFTNIGFLLVVVLAVDNLARVLPNVLSG